MWGESALRVGYSALCVSDWPLGPGIWCFAPVIWPFGPGIAIVLELGNLPFNKNNDMEASIIAGENPELAPVKPIQRYRVFHSSGSIPGVPRNGGASAEQLISCCDV